MPLRVVPLDLIGLGPACTLVAVFATGPMPSGDVGEQVQVVIGNTCEEPRPLSDLWLGRAFGPPEAKRLREQFVAGWFRVREPTLMQPGSSARVKGSAELYGTTSSAWLETNWWALVSPAVPIDEWTIEQSADSPGHFTGTHRRLIVGLEPQFAARVRCGSERECSAMLQALIARGRSQ